MNAAAEAAKQLTPEHVHVQLKNVDPDCIFPVLWKGWNAKMQSNAIVVSGDYSITMPDSAEALTPFDDDGCKLFMVPDSEIAGWMTDEDVEQYHAFRDADERLLSYARG